MLERLASRITHLLGIGGVRRSLAQLERMGNSARRAQSEADLQAVVAAADELADALEGHDRSKALLVAFNARQALAGLGRARLPATLDPTVELQAETDPRPREPEHDTMQAPGGVRRPLHAAGASAGAHEQRADLAADLKELAALHAAGELSDEEFERAKRKLLG